MLLLLACDIGSSYTKVALLNGPKSGHDIIHASYSKYLPLEQQNRLVWQQLIHNIGCILAKHTDVTIEAFCLSSHGPSLIAIDDMGEPIASPNKSYTPHSPQ